VVLVIEHPVPVVLVLLLLSLLVEWLCYRPKDATQQDDMDASR
jgi:hypothetical protein